MADFRQLKPSDAVAVPWKNGRGMSYELAVSPAGATVEKGDFDWRIAKAAVAEPGPFSSYPGFDRVLVVVDGAGLVLDHGDARPKARVEKLTPYGFAGEWTTTAELPDGPVADFNVIVRRGARRADVRVASPGGRSLRLPLETGDAFVHVLAGPIVARSQADGRMFVLAPGDSLLVRGAKQGEEIDLAGPGADCTALFVRVRAE